MITSSRRKPRLPSHRLPLIPVLLVVPVALTGLYAAGVPWVVTALDAFWAGVDHLGRYTEVLWAVANLSWVGVAWLFLRLHRLTQWNQQVLSALKAAMDEAEVVRALGRNVLADLAHTRGIPRRDRTWVSSMLAALTPPDHDDTAGTQEQQWHPGAATKEPDENEMNNDAHAGASPTGAAEPGIREVVRDLTGHLGPTLVAVMAGSQDPGIAVQWAGDDGPAPDPPAESKLRLAHRVWAGLSAAEGDEVARLWFLGTNPWLDGISPVEAIAQGRAQAVLGAARAMIEDRHAG